MRIDPLQPERRQPAGLGFSGGPPFGIAEQLCLEGEVDRTARDVERQLLRREVVLEQRDREGEGDAAGKASGVVAQGTLDDGRRQGHLGPVQAGDAEQAQDRPLAGQRGRHARPSTPRSRQVRRQAEDTLERRGQRIRHRTEREWMPTSIVVRMFIGRPPLGEPCVPAVRSRRAHRRTVRPSR